MIKRKGLAQIPLMIGLLIMAVAVPVATKLVQENQETRNQAAMPSCGSSGTISQCGFNGGCSTGYRCLPNGCSYDPACGGFVPTNTPRPTATPTKRPTATPTKRPTATPTPNPCNVSTGKPNNCTCTYSNQCASGYCAGSTVCLPKPTNTPTKRPTATPTPNPCSNTTGRPNGCSCTNYWQCTSASCIAGKCQAVSATATPTPNPCNVSTGKPNNCTCTYSNQCASGYCAGSTVCLPKPTNTPTKRPTATPTPNPCSNTTGRPNGCSCTNYWQCTSASCIAGKCQAVSATATPTPNPCNVSTGKPNNCTCTYSNQCASGYCAGSTVCLPKPTNTPTKKPTVTPTKAPCKTAGQLCNTTTQLCCPNQGIKCEAAICCVIDGNTPPNNDKNYCCSRYISGAKCAPKPTVTPVCYKDYSICTTNSQCCSGICQGICKPKPTATPTKTCSKTGGTCNFQGDCCSGNVCWNGHCYLSSGPTQVPTTKPTGTNPTSGPIIPTTKPGDRCPEAQACPNPSNKNLLQNCTPPDSDGTPNDTLCTKAGVIEPCGGKNYCCPSAGGAWTTDMTKCKDSPIPTDKPIVCTQCPGKPQAKLKGDADCSGITNINDASIWRSEFISSLLGKTVKNNWRADFDCDGKVTLNDISIWRDNFIKSL